MAETNGDANLNTKNGNFICGVVEGIIRYRAIENIRIWSSFVIAFFWWGKKERGGWSKGGDWNALFATVIYIVHIKRYYFLFSGFYGRPWTTEQRKDLFQKQVTSIESNLH